ncbi:MAG: hypothetical protein H0U74_13475 [Bradymonadaceae bacterium]|nr:hypothetical protein [Lujinxingiaceae bacterium]
MKIKQIIAGAFGVALLAGSLPVSAEEPLDFSQYKVVAVQPVLFGSKAESRYVQGTAHAASSASAERVRAVAASAPSLAQEEGLGFGGSSTSSDIESMGLGYIVGILPLLMADAETLNEILTSLESTPLVQGYHANVQQNLTALVSSARRDQLDTLAYLEFIRSAVGGMAGSEDPAVQRFHGYLLVGYWAGLALVASEVGDLRPVLVNSGKSLITLLVEDASYGGSDRKLAALVAEVVSKLEAGTANKDSVLKAAQAMLAVQPDQEP